MLLLHLPFWAQGGSYNAVSSAQNATFKGFSHSWLLFIPQHMCVHSHFSCVWLSAAQWTAACQLLCPWDSPGRNTGVGCQALLQGSSWPRDLPLSPTATVLHVDSLPLSYWGSPSPFRPPVKCPLFRESSAPNLANSSCAPAQLPPITVPTLPFSTPSTFWATLVSVRFVHIQFTNLINASCWGKKEGKLKHTDTVTINHSFLNLTLLTSEPHHSLFEGCSLHYRMFSSIPGRYPLDIWYHPNIQLWPPTQSPDTINYIPQGANCPQSRATALTCDHGQEARSQVSWAILLSSPHRYQLTIPQAFSKDCLKLQPMYIPSSHEEMSSLYFYSPNKQEKEIPTVLSTPLFH